MSKLENLFARKEELLRQLEEVNKEINSSDLSFSEWVEYADKRDYEYLTYLPQPMRELLEDFGWNRYEMVTIEQLIQYFEDDADEEDESYGVSEETQKALMDANFGSVVCDW